MGVAAFYGICLVLAMLNAALFVMIRSRHNNFYYGILILCSLIASAGYNFLAISRTMGEAVLATKIAYIGGCFLPSIILLCVLEICNVDIKWYGRGLLVLISSLVYVTVLTIGYSGRYQFDPAAPWNGDVTTLLFLDGKLFIPFRAQIVVFLLIIIGVCIFTFRENKAVSYKNMVYLLGVAFITAASHYVGKLVFPTFSIMPLAYVLNGYVILALQQRLALYDISSVVMQSIANQSMYGYIILDMHKNYIGSDEAAKKFFPQIAPLHVDFNLPKDDPLFIKMSEQMNELDDTLNVASGYFMSNGHEYSIDTAYITNKKGHHLGYFIEIADATEARENEKQMAGYNERLRLEVERETRHLKDVQDQMLLGMANMIENRDNNTGGHIKRTSMGVKILVKELMVRDEWEGVFPAKYCEAMIKAAPLHDVGKIAVDDDILKKPGRFTPGEFEQMKMHAPKGAELLHSVIASIEDPYFVQIAENMAHYHHERWNGTGYPDKLTGEQIPMEARVMAIADVYDALVSKRCYKDAMTYEEAATIIREGMGTQFDPALADVFETCRPRLEKYYSAQLKLADAAV
ncbi:MAG: HD domain-containing protein [Lachnospiraceae bacterium]|nr:HD domain-containing protein [Lachnospiraceae bacterium]